MFHATLTNSTDLDRWAGRLDARSQLPRLIRRLVYATTPDAAHVAFPADEGIQLGGWDGVVRAAAGRGCVPAGTSVWEMGVTADARHKAEGDYRKRSHDAKTSPRPQVVRSETTFVFVTPRRWGGKSAWVEERRAEGVWRDVRAYDAEDLSQWLEQAPAVHLWVSALLGKRPPGALSLDDFWADWTGETDPPLRPDLVTAGREAVCDKVVTWLRAAPGPLAVSGDTAEEALAFLAAVVDGLDDEERTAVRSRAVVVDDAHTWRSLATTPDPLILIPRFERPEGVGRFVGAGHHVFLPLAPTEEPGTLLLPRLNRASAELALTAMGFGDVSARDLATLARRSLPALRRKLAVAPALQRPVWARPEEARVLLAPLLAGAWQEPSEGDREAIARLAGVPYDDVQAGVVRWANEPDPPLRRVGDVWMVASREDAWLLLARHLTGDDLARFESVALDVLAERDPALDLPPEGRFAAGLRGKVLRHSGRLREGLAETLALMAAMGREAPLTGGATGEEAARRTVWALLERAKVAADVWASLSYHLPLVAEAAPGVFLDAVDVGLGGDNPLLMALFQDRGPATSFGSSSPHTGLLWALETLAWSPEHFARAVLALARLAALDPGGTLGNRPAGSLRDIFLCWHPNTAAPLPRRLAALDMIRRREPGVAWRLMMRLLPKNGGSVSPTHRTRWRDWLPDPWEATTNEEYIGATDSVLERLLLDAGADMARWCDLVKACGEMTPDQRERLLERLEGIDPNAFSSEDRARARDGLREIVGHHRGFPEAHWAMPGTHLDRLEDVYARLEPDDAVARHRWLFKSWVRTPGARRGRWEKDVSVVDGLRDAALGEILDAHGWEGAVRLAQTAEEPGLVGAALGRSGLPPQDQNGFLEGNLAAPERWGSLLAKGFVTTSALRGGDTWIRERLEEAAGRWTAEQGGQFFLALPFDMGVVDRVDLADKDVQQHFWSRVTHVAFPDSTGDADRLLTRLITFGRPHIAVDSMEWALSRTPALFPPDRVAAALEAAVTTAPGTDFNGSSFAYRSADLLSGLERTDLPRERLAQLEWMYVGIHEYYRHPRLLHDEMARDPELFIELLKLVYRSKNRPEPEAHHSEAEAAELAAKATTAWKLLDSWKALPGRREDGTVDAGALRGWVSRARALAAECDRTNICDVCIGHLFASSPAGTDGAWPHEAVRDLIEETAAPDIENGWLVQNSNNRGVTTRLPTDGGEQERALVSRYEAYSDRVSVLWPRTAAALKKVADDYRRQAAREDERAALTEDFWR